MNALVLEQHIERKRQRRIRLAGVHLQRVFTLFAGLGIIGVDVLFMSLSVCAQALPYSILKTEIVQLTKQIEAATAQQDQLLYKNKELAEKINATKQQLEKGGHLLLELRLQNDLKASRALADQIQALDRKVYNLTEQLIGLRKQLVGALDVEIESLSREAATTIDAKERLQRLQHVLQLQKEKAAYQTQITEESNEVLLALEVTIAEKDGPDDILQKAAIIEDQRDIIRNRKRELDRQIQNTQKELSLRRNMLELLRDIGRGEEDEFDLNRNLRMAELQETIEGIEASLEILQAKKETWQAKEGLLEKKARHFYQEATNLMERSLKGDSSEPR